VNVAARLEGLAEPGGIRISRVVPDQVRDKLDFAFEDMGEQQVKNIARPVRVYRVRDAATPIERPLPILSPPISSPRQAVDCSVAVPEHERRPGAGVFRGRYGRGDHHRSFAHSLALRHRPQFELYLQGSSRRCEADRPRTGCPLCPRRLSPQGGPAHPDHRPADRDDDRRASLGRPLRRLARGRVRASGSGCRQRRRVIEPALQAAETARSATRPTEDLTAYDLYLRAYAMTLSSRRQVPEALRLLERRSRATQITARPSPGPRPAVFGCCLTGGVRIPRWTV
jgi:hypothetical protein